LSDLFASLLTTEQVQFRITDSSPGDNVLDFTQGVDGGLINVGSPPVVAPTGVPEPGSLALLAAAFGAFAVTRRRKKT
jgi:hypothetical protein